VVDVDTINTFKSRVHKNWLCLYFLFRINWNRELFNLYVMLLDTGKEEYLRSFFALDWIGLPAIDQ